MIFPLLNIDYSWMWWERNFYGFLEFYFNGLGNDQYTEALTDPDLSERLERGELHTLGRAYLCGHIRIHIRAKWPSLAQARDFL